MYGKRISFTQLTYKQQIHFDILHIYQYAQEQTKTSTSIDISPISNFSPLFSTETKGSNVPDWLINFHFI